MEEGVFTCRTQTRYNAVGGLLVSGQKQLISKLNNTLEKKVIAMNERGLTSVDWAVYNNGTKRTRYSSVPTSDITAETVLADGVDVIACRFGHHALRHITRKSPRKIGEGLDKRRSSFAPQGRAGNGVPASHPTQSVATRPLAIRKDGTWYAYGWDLTKNICEVFGQHGYLRTAYTYSPYGEVTADGDVTQPIQWSSEYNDTETALVYYNYRHYNPLDGRWIGRDMLGESDWLNVYGFVKNGSSMYFDQNGNGIPAVIGLVAVLALYSCAVYASMKAIDYSANDKQQHCYTTCIMAKRCGGKLTAVPIAILKEILDMSYELLRRELGFITREQYNRVVVDSIKDYYADMKCIDAKNEADCGCCCKTA